MRIEEKFKNKLSNFTEGNTNIFFYWKGRVALFALLKSMGVDEGDEVILPAFTCVVVPNAILYCGAKPIYVDILSETYNIDFSKIENVITSKTKVIICQNTFGLSSNIEDIKALALRYNLYTIEDCTHGFGGLYNGRFNGINCDAAFFSTQWNKPFSTGIGGFALINNSRLIDNIKYLEKNKIKPSLSDNLSILVLNMARKLFVNSFTYWFILSFYRFLSINGVVLGSSSKDEIDSIIEPVNFFKGMSIAQFTLGLFELGRFNNLLEKRKKNAVVYTDFLKKHRKTCVVEKLFDNHSFLKYPILVKNRNVFFDLAKKNKIEIGDWFISPLHPIEKELDKWCFDDNKYPVAKEISRLVVNLPLEKKNIGNVLAFLNENLEFII